MASDPPSRAACPRRACGIAAYKTCHVVSRSPRRVPRSRSRRRGRDPVRSPLTFQALSVVPSSRASGTSWTTPIRSTSAWRRVSISRSSLPARWPSPRPVAGFADDAVTAILAALDRSRAGALAPSMNAEMWGQPSNQRSRGAPDTADAIEPGEMGPAGGRTRPPPRTRRTAGRHRVPIPRPADLPRIDRRLPPGAPPRRYRTPPGGFGWQGSAPSYTRDGPSSRSETSRCCRSSSPATRGAVPPRSSGAIAGRDGRAAWYERVRRGAAVAGADDGADRRGCRRGIAGACDPVVVAHTDSDFQPGQYIVVAGFVEWEIAASRTTFPQVPDPGRSHRDAVRDQQRRGPDDDDLGGARLVGPAHQRTA